VNENWWGITTFAIILNKKIMTEVGTFEQIVKRGCGLDVHKQTVVATIDGEGLKQETREFGTTTRSLTELKEWLVREGITHVAMESTTKEC